MRRYTQTHTRTHAHTHNAHSYTHILSRSHTLTPSVSPQRVPPLKSQKRKAAEALLSGRYSTPAPLHANNIPYSAPVSGLLLPPSALTSTPFGDPLSPFFLYPPPTLQSPLTTQTAHDSHSCPQCPHQEQQGLFNPDLPHSIHHHSNPQHQHHSFAHSGLQHHTPQHHTQLPSTTPVWLHIHDQQQQQQPPQQQQPSHSLRHSAPPFHVSPQQPHMTSQKRTHSTITHSPTRAPPQGELPNKRQRIDISAHAATAAHLDPSQAHVSHARTNVVKTSVPRHVAACSPSCTSPEPWCRFDVSVGGWGRGRGMERVV
jgi:hypothetical protein